MSNVYAINDSENLVVIKNDGVYVTINTQTTDVVSTATSASFSTEAGWSVNPPNSEYPTTWGELAQSATCSMSVNVSQDFNSSKVFRVPKAVTEENLGLDTTATLEEIYEFADSDIYNFSREGEHTFAWVDKIISQNPKVAVMASAFTVDEDVLYFGVPEAEDEPFRINQLLRFEPNNDSWSTRNDGEWAAVESVPENLIELDPDSVEIMATFLDHPEAQTDTAVEFTNYFPEEYGLFFSAESELDFELLDRMFDIYDTQERSINAQKQVRGPGGKFGGGGPATQEPAAAPVEPPVIKARLSASLPLIPNIADRIAQYLAEVEEQRAQAKPETPAEPVKELSLRERIALKQALSDSHKLTGEFAVTAEAAGVETTDVRPLYVAIVDSIDTDAVLDLVALVPPKAGTENADVSSWKRSEGKWVSAPEILQQMRGSTPPSVVELSDETVLKNLVEQVDKTTVEDAKPLPEATPAAPAATPPAEAPAQPVAASGQKTSLKKDSRDSAAKSGEALDDGSYPIKNKEDLKKAIQAYGRAKDKAKAKRHIIKRARALKATDLIPDDWKKSYAARGFAFTDGSLLILDVDDLKASITEATTINQQMHVNKRAKALNRIDLIPSNWDLKTQNFTQEGEMWGPYGELLPAVTAAGGPDRNRGNAERLRRYWTTGPGGAKIAWTSPGDWTRCVAQLSKYLGSRARGYCNLRHFEMNGYYPGDRRNQ